MRACALSLLLATVPLAAGRSQTPRQVAARIRAGASSHRQVHRDLYGQSSEGAELVAYFAGDTLVRIQATLYGEMGQSRVEAYFSGGAPILVADTTDSYDKPLSGKVVDTKGDVWVANPIPGHGAMDNQLGRLVDILQACARAPSSDAPACREPKE